MSDFEREFSAVPKEIERKFLVNQLRMPDLTEVPYNDIAQGYLAIEPSGSEVRIRDENGTYTLAKKMGKGMVRGEMEYPISKEMFDGLWPGTEGRVVQKRRYTIPHSGRIIELDIFSKPLHVVLAEVEFPSLDAAEAFEKPDWFAADVTNDPNFKNQTLAMHAKIEAVGGIVGFD